MPKSRSLPALFFFSMSAVALISLAAFGLAWSISRYQDYEREAEIVKSLYLHQQKEMIKAQVEQAVDYIEHANSMAEARLKYSISSRTQEALDLATRLYQANKDYLEPDSLKRLIVESLRPIRFNKGRGYYFMTSLNGTELLFADKPEFEGRNLLDFKSLDGKLVIRDMIEIVKKDGQGFYDYLWTKPGSEGAKHRKFAHVRLFPPLNCFIGTGDYLDDVQAEIMDEVLQYLVKIRFGDENYIFGSILNGDSLFTNGNVTKGSGNILGLTDPNGVKIIVEQQQAAQNPEGGFVNYSWRKLKTQDPTPKVAFVKAYRPWSWMIGAGVYLDAIDAELAARKAMLRRDMIGAFTNMFIFFVLLFVLISLATFLFSRRLKRETNILAEHFGLAEKKGALIDSDRLGLQEFRGLAENANAMARRRDAAESALMESEEKYRRLVENIPDVIWTTDQNGRTSFISPNVERVLGFTPGEVIDSGEQISMGRIHPDDVNLVRDRYGAFFASNAPFEVEYRFQHKDGRWIWLHDRAMTSYERDGVRHADGIFSDISERKKTFEELKRLRVYLKDVIDSMPSILIGVDNELSITKWSRKAETETGLSAGEVVGRSLQEVLPQLGPVIAQIRRAIEQNTPFKSPRISRMVKDRTKYEDVLVYPLTSGDEQGAVIRIEDVTERARIEEMLVQSEKMVSVGGLAAGMAHEINNPLAAIVGGAQMVKKRLSPDFPKNRKTAEELGVSLEDVRDYLEHRGVLGMISSIYEAGVRAGEIVANMLSFSRDNASTPAPCGLESLMDKTLELLSSDYSLSQRYDFKRIEIVKEYESGLPSAVCEESKLRQVFMNILRNGAEAMSEKSYTPDEPPRFRIGLKKAGDMVRIEIEDNGPGMPEEVRKRIFEPFFTTKTVGLGAGLGLSVSYFIVTEGHSGRMSVESSPGEWTRFIVELPFDGSGKEEPKA